MTLKRSLPINIGFIEKNRKCGRMLNFNRTVKMFLIICLVARLGLRSEDGPRGLESIGGGGGELSKMNINVEFTSIIVYVCYSVYLKYVYPYFIHLILNFVSL